LPLAHLPGLAGGGSRRSQAGFKEVSGGQGKPRAPDRWPESSGRSLDADIQVEAFSCQVWSFSVFLWARAGIAEGELARSWAVSGGVGNARNGGLRPSVNDKHRCWRLEAGGWRLEAGGGRLEAGAWQEHGRSFSLWMAGVRMKQVIYTRAELNGIWGVFFALGGELLFLIQNPAVINIKLRCSFSRCFCSGCSSSACSFSVCLG
jgi:hypothetical protein